jgi:hypothetical protein
LLAREKRGLDTHPRQLIHHTSGSVSTRYTEIHAPKELLNARSVAGRISIAALVRAGSGGRASAVDQAVMRLSDEGGRCADKIGRRVARIVIADLDRVGRFFLHQPADQRLSGCKWLFAHCTRTPYVRQRRGGRSRHSRAGQPSAHGHSMPYLRVATMEVATETSGVAAERTVFFGQETTVGLTKWKSQE